ncbi:Zinc finger protein ZAT3 [Sesamum alatum]|uniref:Zinc finger protein ZAT3 n=1 Tax=Sesamum alatum TaxID=300844 RepID=A0AAE2CX08_9LAMI|nr:Zinc finger protein ZAT3 [Sesamum alatum]
MDDTNNCPNSSDDVLSSVHHHHHHRNRKKRTNKFLSIINDVDTASTSKSKPSRKPDPAAPKITRPCTECGKKFWSWKALFGHMRCHPERQWRGINPPPNMVRQTTAAVTTEEDHEIATCLLMLANAPPQSPSTVNQAMTTSAEYNYCSNIINSELGNINNNVVVDGVGGFECSSCKKVFGSHQALGGHRASHKNVKGCFANTNTNTNYKKDDEEEVLLVEGWMDEDDDDEDDDDNDMNNNNNEKQQQQQQQQQQMLVSSSSLGGGHKCSICLRVFSSGQALGGHKRCHWEKMDAPTTTRVCAGLDLNICPADHYEDHVEEDDDGACSSYNNCSAGVVANLDLRLRL